MPAESIRFLRRGEVRACLAKLDAGEVVTETLRQHALGRTRLPSEGYLGWTDSAGAANRSIAMLGAVPVTGGTAYGLKLINASLGNPGRGLERAGGVGVLFDPETARPALIAEAGLLSAVRTAAYTVVSLRELGPPEFDAVSLIGAGTLAAAHLDALVAAFPELRRCRLYDLDPARAEHWAAEARPGTPGSTSAPRPTPGRPPRPPRS